MNRTELLQVFWLFPVVEHGASCVTASFSDGDRMMLTHPLATSRFFPSLLPKARRGLPRSQVANNWTCRLPFDLQNASRDQSRSRGRATSIEFASRRWTLCKCEVSQMQNFAALPDGVIDLSRYLRHLTKKRAPRSIRPPTNNSAVILLLQIRAIRVDYLNLYILYILLFLIIIPLFILSRDIAFLIRPNVL